MNAATFTRQNMVMRVTHDKCGSLLVKSFYGTRRCGAHNLAGSK